MSTSYDLVIVGAGLSALSAIRAGLADGEMLLLDYQEAPGGFLRHALPAPGFEDAWELIRSLRFPRSMATSFSTTAVGLLPAPAEGEPHRLLVRQRQGTLEIQAHRLLIACGGLELTREHAQIPGSRPAGVMTPILAHQLLARGYLPGKRAVVYGHSCYTTITARRLMQVGMEAILVDPAQSELVAVEGFPRLQQVMLRRKDSGELQHIAADVLVYGTGMQANTRWLKGSGVLLRPGGAIQVDERYQTSVRGIYATGTVVSPSLDHTDSLWMGKKMASLLAGGQA
ncbi:MAG: FAD-dependent oxidoreductase [Ktedonobacteraceae bacterium]|nr:FAD-dependent oxidoreductase [Ktedonobacteraceae bacterium]